MFWVAKFLGFIKDILKAIVELVVKLFIWTIQSWERIVMVALVVLSIIMYIGIYARDNTIKDLRLDLNKSKEALAYVQNSLRQNAVYYDLKLKEYNGKAPQIIVKHNTMYKAIEDSNLSLKDKVFKYIEDIRNEIDKNSSN